MWRIAAIIAFLGLISCEPEVEPYMVPKGSGNPIPYHVIFSEDKNWDGKADYTVWAPVDPADSPPGTKTIYIDSDHDGFFDQVRHYDGKNIQEESLEAHRLEPVFGLRTEKGENLRKFMRHIMPVGDTWFHIIIHQGIYDFSSHQLTGGVADATHPARVDGVDLAGTDGAMPHWDDPDGALDTITKIELFWGDEEITVPKKLHINLLSLTLCDEDDWKSQQFIPNAAGDAVLMQALGGDGGGSYMVSFIFRKNGKHRQVYHGYWEDGLPSAEDAWKIALENGP